MLTKPLDFGILTTALKRDLVRMPRRDGVHAAVVGEIVDGAGVRVTV